MPALERKPPSAFQRAFPTYTSTKLRPIADMPNQLIALDADGVLLDYTKPMAVPGHVPSAGSLSCVTRKPTGPHRPLACRAPQWAYTPNWVPGCAGVVVSIAGSDALGACRAAELKAA